MGTGHFLLLMDFAIQKLYIAAAGRMHCKIILKQTFSGSKVYAVRTVSRDYQSRRPTHVIITLGSRFLLSTLHQSTLVRISLSITSEEPARELSVVKIYKLPSW